MIQGWFLECDGCGRFWILVRDGCIGNSDMSSVCVDGSGLATNYMVQPELLLVYDHPWRTMVLLGGRCLVSFWDRSGDGRLVALAQWVSLSRGQL